MSKDKPCRVCKQIPEKGFPPARVLNSDWICVKCSNAKRDLIKTRKRYVKKEKEYTFKKTPQKIKYMLSKLRNKKVSPACPICERPLEPSRTSKSKGKKLYWHCVSCNDNIVTLKL